jgi:hypothetical protein
MLEVQILSYDKLPKEIDKAQLSNNGSGKEYANYIIVRHNDKVILVESDAMEPEDCKLLRDLYWVPIVILRAYRIGLEESKLTNP